MIIGEPEGEVGVKMTLTELLSGVSLVMVTTKGHCVFEKHEVLLLPVDKEMDCVVTPTTERTRSKPIESSFMGDGEGRALAVSVCEAQRRCRSRFMCTRTNRFR